MSGAFDTGGPDLKNAKRYLAEKRAIIAGQTERYRQLVKEPPEAATERMKGALAKILRAVTNNVGTLTGERALYVLGRVQEMIEAAVEPEVFIKNYEAQIEEANKLAAICEPQATRERREISPNA